MTQRDSRHRKEVGKGSPARGFQVTTWFVQSHQSPWPCGFACDLPVLPSQGPSADSVLWGQVPSWPLASLHSPSLLLGQGSFHHGPEQEAKQTQKGRETLYNCSLMEPGWALRTVVVLIRFLSGFELTSLSRVSLQICQVRVTTATLLVAGGCR